MKKYLLVILMFLYLGVSSGIILNIHHCMGKIVEVDLWQNEMCPSCKEKKQTHHCCSTDTQLVKMTVDQNIDQIPVIDYTPVALSLLFDINDLLVLSEADGSTLFNPFYNTPPDECSGAELCIRNCSFLI